MLRRITSAWSAYFCADGAATGLSLHQVRFDSCRRVLRRGCFTDVLAVGSGALPQAKNSTDSFVGRSTPEIPLLARQILQGMLGRERSQRWVRAIIRRYADLQNSLAYLAPGG